jgi:nucleoid DNA-binding protein
MSKAQNKTTETNNSVEEFLRSVTDETKRNDSLQLVQLMQQHTGFTAKMWGPAIVGFGSYHYKYASGREGDAPLVGFSPRAKEISLYFAQDFTEKEKLLPLLGKHRTGAGCVYIKNLQHIHIEVLAQLITASVRHLQQQYPA